MFDDKNIYTLKIIDLFFLNKSIKYDINSNIIKIYYFTK